MNYVNNMRRSAYKWKYNNIKYTKKAFNPSRDAKMLSV